MSCPGLNVPQIAILLVTTCQLFIARYWTAYVSAEYVLETARGDHERLSTPGNDPRSWIPRTRFRLPILGLRLKWSSVQVTACWFEILDPYQ
ncbi:hypothetical protein BS17DRAFT_278253 [Gyrodon lividus]|nr:hypothetical protein BS17DRAFT_278253 [Gyrodon lividus]